MKKSAKLLRDFSLVVLTVLSVTLSIMFVVHDMEVTHYTETQDSLRSKFEIEADSISNRNIIPMHWIEQGKHSLPMPEMLINFIGKIAR